MGYWLVDSFDWSTTSEIKAAMETAVGSRYSVESVKARRIIPEPRQDWREHVETLLRGPEVSNQGALRTLGPTHPSLMDSTSAATPSLAWRW